MKLVCMAQNRSSLQFGCVYKITCCDKYYVGRAINFYKRMQRHVWALRNNRHPNQFLQRVWNSYGEDSFDVVVLDKSSNVDELQRLEQKYLDEGFDGESMNLVSLSLGGYPTHIKHHYLGKKLSSEHRRKMSESSKGTNTGSKNGMSRLTESDIRTIRHLKKNKTAKEISEMFGITRLHVYDICSRRRWAHVV